MTDGHVMFIAGLADIHSPGSHSIADAMAWSPGSKKMAAAHQTERAVGMMQKTTLM